MTEYFPEPKSLARKIKIELDWSNYSTKADLKTAAGIDRSTFAEKIDLAHLKSSGDKLDIDELKNVPTKLSNIKSEADKFNVDKLVIVPNDLSDVVKNDVVKKMYIMLTSKVLKIKYLILLN